MQTAITIPKAVTRGMELVVIRREEYERLERRLLELKDALGKIRRGEKELLSGKARAIKSLSELTE